MRVIIDVVDTLGLVSFQGEVGVGRAKVPDLDRPVQTRRSKSVGILGVDGHAHHVVAVALEDLNTLPAFLPIPQLNCHVIACGEDERLGRVNAD